MTAMDRLKQSLLDLVDRLADREASYGDWQDAVAADPTEPRIYEGDQPHEG